MQYVTKTVFASVIKAYLESSKFQGLTPNTQQSYRYFLRLAEHPDSLGSVPVEEIRPALVQAFLDGLADRPATQQKARTVMKALERWAIVRDQLSRPITTGTEAPGSDGGHVPWSEKQIAHGEAHARAWLSRFITLAANTGQRGSDLITMRWTDIELIDGHPGINVVQKKTKLEIWVPFTQALIAAMKSWQREPGFILRKWDGLHWDSRAQLTDAWIREARRPEMAPLRDMVLHGLRGAAVVRLRRAGCSIPQICDMVGMSPQMVKRYCRKSDQKENALAAVFRLDGRRLDGRDSDENTG